MSAFLTVVFFVVRLTPAFQPRRLMFAPAAVGCKRLLAFVRIGLVRSSPRTACGSHAFQGLRLCESDSGTSAAGIAPSRLQYGQSIYRSRPPVRSSPVEGGWLLSLHVKPGAAPGKP